MYIKNQIKYDRKICVKKILRLNKIIRYIYDRLQDLRELFQNINI